MCLWVGLCLLTLSSLPCVRADLGPHCPHHTDTHSGEVSFVPTPVGYIQACEEERRKLVCCLNNYDNLSHDLVWQVYDSDTWRAVNMSVDIEFDEDNQVLVLKQTQRSQSGEYRCMVSTEGQPIYSTAVQVNVDVCPENDYPPHILVPPRDTIEVTPRGSVVNLTCSAEFGDDFWNDPETALLWIKYTGSGSNGTRSMIRCYDGVAYMYENILISAVSVSSRLECTVSMNVTERDFASYDCLAMNSAGTTHRNITLIEGDPNISSVIMTSGDDVMSQTVAIILVTLVVSSLVLLALTHRHWDDIRLHVKEQFGKPKHPDAVYDALLVHAESSERDAAFVGDTLLPMLETKLGYRIAITSRDAVIGKAAIAENLYDLVEWSQCIIFLLSPDTINNQWTDFIFQSFVAEQHSNFVFISLSQLSDDVWHVDQSGFRDVIRSSKKLVTWPGTMENSTERIVDSTESENLDSKKSIFWKKLRLALPVRLSAVKCEGDELPVSGEKSYLALHHQLMQKIDNSKTNLIEDV